MPIKSKSLSYKITVTPLGLLPYVQLPKNPKYPIQIVICFYTDNLKYLFHSMSRLFRIGITWKFEPKTIQRVTTRISIYWNSY